MRDLYISIGILRSIEGDKYLIEAVAFAVLIKQHRINSLITNATHRKLKTVFGRGENKRQYPSPHLSAQSINAFFS